MINRSYAGCSKNSAARLATTSTSSTEQVVLQHSQPTQQVIYHLLHDMCSPSFALSRHISNGQSAVSSPEPAEPTSSSSILPSLLAPCCLAIGSLVLGTCGFAELLFGTAGPPLDCNHDYMMKS
jgi:hypothetical protein